MAWRTTLTFGLVASALTAFGCSTTTGNSADGGANLNGTGGASAGTGGETSTGGDNTSTGGSGGTCSIDNAGTDACAGCIASHCMDEYCACTGTCATEYKCIAQCLQNGFAGKDGGSMDLQTCAGNCASADGGGQVASETDDLLSCIDTKGDAGTEACSTQCFGFALNP